MPNTEQDELADLKWWQKAFEPLGCQVGGWTFRRNATVITEDGNYLEVTGDLAKRILFERENQERALLEKMREYAETHTSTLLDNHPTCLVYDFAKENGIDLGDKNE